MAFRNVCKIVSVVLGPLLIILGVCVKWAIFPTVVDNLVHSYLTLDPTNEDTWKTWMEPTSQQPIHMKFTFFNVENADEVVANIAKPRVTEKGAFAYREVQRKEHVRSLLDEISYGSYKHYEFDADASDAESKDPESTVTIINPVMAIVNAVQLQLHERLLQFSSFDTIFSWLNLDCADLAPVLPAICMLIPTGDTPIPCPKTPIAHLQELIDALCTHDSTPDDQDSTPDSILLHYENGQISLPDLPDNLGDVPGLGPLLELLGLSRDQTQPILCADLIPTSLDCADPLGLWKRAENLLLNPLKDLTNCEPADFPEDVSICNGTDDSAYHENGCFCDGLTMTDTVNNLVFKGAHSGMLLALHNVLETADLTTLMPNIFPILELLLPESLSGILTQLKDALAKIDLASWIDETLANMGMDLLDLKHGKFGFFRGPNGSNATRSWWKINSGKYQFDLYNQITEFNGMTKLPENWWYGFGPTPSAHASGVRGICHDMIGTDGISYPPQAITKEDPIWIFNSDLARSIWLNYVGEADVDGVTTYQYSPRPEVFAMTNPDNFCYCPKVEQCAKKDENEEDAWDISDCQDKNTKLEACIDGLLDLQGPKGVPIIMSTPHFLDAHESLPKAIDGVEPDPEKHITFLNIEPTTGMSLQAHKRIQVSVPVAHSDYFKDLIGLEDPANRTIWPVVWVDEGADATQENLDLVKSMLVTPFILVDVFTGVLIGIGGVLLILSAALHFFCKPSARNF